MKKANYALFQSRSWKPYLGKMAWAMVFAWCCLGFQEATAQTDTVVTAIDLSGAQFNTCSTLKLDECGGTVDSSDDYFSDDGVNDGNYADPLGRIVPGGGIDGPGSPGRADTVEICPENQWQRVRVVFTDFDLAVGDSLVYYQGDKAAVRGTGMTCGFLRDMAGNYIWDSDTIPSMMATCPGETNGDGAGVPGLGFRRVGMVATALPPSGTGSGVGVHNAFGGWIDADCNPADREDAAWNHIRGNTSGCLTFILKTNGDNIKGAGWEAWVDCQDRDIEIKPAASLVNHKLACDETSATVILEAPTVELCGADLSRGDGADKVDVLIKDHNHTVVFENHQQTGDRTTTWMGIGQFFVTYTMKADRSKTATATFSVQAPPLVANDEISVPIGEGCAIQLTPDDVLENYCNPIEDLMHYEISLTLGSGPKAITRTSTAAVQAGIGRLGTDSIVVNYPMITEADIIAAGLNICDASATVEVSRIYYKFNNMPFPEYQVTEYSERVRTTVKFKDISAPVISAPPSGSITLVGCDTTGLAATLNAVASDNCDDTVPVSYSVNLGNDPCPNIRLITVTMTATDDCGNTGTTSRTYNLERPKEFARARDVELECEEDAVNIPVPGVKVGYRNATGTFVVRDTVDLSEEEYVCGYALVSEDAPIPSTDCGKKLYRYYDVIDWCNPTGFNVFKDTVYIENTDTKAPVFQGEETTFDANFGRTFGQYAPTNIDLGANTCTYNINDFTKPTATDECSSVAVRIDSIFRIEDGSNWPIPSSSFTALDCDSFFVKWIASDDCHEQTAEDTSYQIVVIRDVIAPSAICQDRLTVSVPGDEGARIEIGDIDKGSSDPCGIVTREMRIKGSGAAWADHVIITCEDVHEEVEVEMRVTDKSGNSNICWLTVTAEDKIPPVCQNLPDFSISCKDIHTGELGASTDADGDGQMEDTEWQPLTGDLMEVYNTRFGTPDCVDNLECGTLTIEQEYQLIEEDCGALRVRRRYRANDWKPNSSTWAEQLITVAYEADWTLTFPGDIDLTCADPEIPAPTGAGFIIDNGSCDLWALEVTADTFQVPGDICMKIERTYEVINWCVYTAGDPGTVVANNALGAVVSSEGNESVGRFTYTQVIKLYVSEAPIVTINDVNTCIVGVNDALPYGEEDNTPGAPAYECDTIRTFSASATNCVGASLTDFTWNFKIDGVTVQSGEGASFSQIVSPKVNYSVEFWASDGCGNSAGATKDFEFWDCKKPTPYVLNGIAIELGEDGTVQVWATDLDQGSFDNCTDQANLELYIGIGEPNAGPTDLAGVQALGKVATLTCDNVGTQNISIYVVDEEGNWDVVGTYVLVQANQVDCSTVESGEMMIAGHIVNPNGENVEQVSVSVSGGMQSAMTTGADGEYQFDVNVGSDYTVTPVKDMNPLNGVSTFDLVLISKHILGITTFDSPYKYIAADVNKSGTVTAFDMVQLRQLILNITTEFANNDSWRFVDASHDFNASTVNPAAQDFAEYMDISNMSSNMMNVDFVGVKIGDVNINASANSLIGAESRTTNGTLNFNVADRFVEVGEKVSVEFKSTNIAEAQGYQFTMNFAGLKFDKLEEGVVKATNFNTNLAERGVIATSWNGEATSSDVLFTANFEATTSGLLSELISVSSDITQAEAYNAADELLDINIEFTESTVNANFELAQNSPNPFNGETVIGFNLPEAGTATLTVMNVQGKVLTEIKGDYAKGYNTIVLKASDLGATGLLHYQLESADQVATKKMIIID